MDILSASEAEKDFPPWGDAYPGDLVYYRIDRLLWKIVFVEAIG